MHLRLLRLFLGFSALVWGISIVGVFLPWSAAEEALGGLGKSRRSAEDHSGHGASLLKTCVAVLRNRSRAAHWSPLVHCTMKTATIPVAGFTDKSVP